MKKNKFFYICLLINFIGLIFISSSSSIESQTNYHDPFYYTKKHIFVLFLSLFAYTIISKINIFYIKKFIPLFFISSTLLLLTPFLPFVGTKIFGANRWINIAGFNFQPSEISKISILLYISEIFSKKNYRNILFLLIPVILILFEPNMSNVILIITTIILIYYLMSGNILHILGICIISSLLGLLLILSTPYRRNRIIGLLGNSSESYHNSQIIYSLSLGGFFGRGLGNSIQKFNYLPQVSSDSLLAVVGEETGFLGLSVIIYLYYIFIFNLFELHQVTKSEFSKIFVVSSSIMFFIQSIINLSSMANIIPITGIPLPFFSYGGSSLISSMIILGIINSIRHEKK